MTLAYLGVGSNEGDRQQNLEMASQMLSEAPGVTLLRKSMIYETDPVGGPEQGRFFNAVWELETALSAEDLMGLLLTVEQRLGRKREVKNGPRVIDLDILFYGQEIIESQNLMVPHPRMHQRWFVLKPLSELAPERVHPVREMSVNQMLEAVREDTQKF